MAYRATDRYGRPTCKKQGDGKTWQQKAAERELDAQSRGKGDPKKKEKKKVRR